MCGCQAAGGADAADIGGATGSAGATVMGAVPGPYKNPIASSAQNPCKSEVWAGSLPKGGKIDCRRRRPLPVQASQHFPMTRAGRARGDAANAVKGPATAAPCGPCRCQAKRSAGDATSQWQRRCSAASNGGEPTCRAPLRAHSGEQMASKTAGRFLRTSGRRCQAVVAQGFGGYLPHTDDRLLQ